MLQYSQAAKAPFINHDLAAFAESVDKTLAGIPFGLTIQGAKYPVLRIFASWPGDAKLDRTLRGWTGGDLNRDLTGDDEDHPENDPEDSTEDPDQHPLATLNLENFGQQLDLNYFRGDVEQKLVVPLKREYEHEEEDSRTRRRRKLAENYLNPWLRTKLLC